MIAYPCSRALAAAILLVAFLSGDVLLAQEPPVPAQPPSTLPIPVPRKSATNVAAPCVEPPLVRLGDYNGPLSKTVGLFARDLERKAVHPPDYKVGRTLCSFTPKDKFVLFVQDSVDPVTFLVSGFDAGLAQAENRDPTFGQGMAGYGKRYGAEFADQASFKFFKDFAYPSIFSEDPRYYRRMHGSGGRRLLHAASHVVVAHRDNGTEMFNFSEWLGTTSAVALSNLYHPGNQRGFAPAAEEVGLNIAVDLGLDVLREFLPEISHKFRLPFTSELVPPDPGSNPATR